MADLLSALAELGRASVAALWVPVALWTVVALVAEAALRIGRAPAVLGLPVRGATLAALPTAVALPALLDAVAPEAASAVATAAPILIVLPELVVGEAGPTLEGASPGPEAGAVALGLLLVGLAATAAVALVRLGVGARAARAARHLPPAPEAVRTRLDTVVRRLGIDRPVAVVTAPPGSAPFTVGWRRPVVAVPGALTGDALDVALVHEAAHVARGDYAWHAAQEAVAAVFAAHPVVHLLRRGLDLDRERAADAVVVRACPGARRTYADLLFSYASLPAPALALGATPGSSYLRSRIDAMARLTPLHRRRSLVRSGRAVGAAVVALVATFTLAAAPTGVALSSADRTVEGAVVDADTRGPVVAASLRVAGTSVGAATGLDGRYRMTVPDGAHVVQISAAGYEERVVRLDDGQTTLDVALVSRNLPAPPSGAASESQAGAPEPDVFEVAEVQPELIGGLVGLQARVEYPPLARGAGIEGQVVVQFVVNKEGTVEDAVVLRSPHDMLSEAALQAVHGSRFEPGRQRGEPVKVRFAVPIMFRLPADDTGALDPARRGRVQIDLAAGPPLATPNALAEASRGFTYPPLAARAGIEAAVEVGFTLDALGRVVETRTTAEPGGGLKEAASALVARLRFDVAEAGDEGMARVTFRLD